MAVSPPPPQSRHPPLCSNSTFGGGGRNKRSCFCQPLAPPPPPLFLLPSFFSRLPPSGEKRGFVRSTRGVLSLSRPSSKGLLLLVADDLSNLPAQYCSTVQTIHARARVGRGLLAGSPERGLCANSVCRLGGYFLSLLSSDLSISIFLFSLRYRHT